MTDWSDVAISIAAEMNPRVPDETNQKTMAITSSGVFMRQQALGSLKQINVSLAPVNGPI